MTKYKEIMDRVEVSEEMQSRVLKNVEVHFEKKRRKKRLALWAPVVGVLAAAAVLILLLKPWQGRKEVSATETGNTTTTVTTGDTEDMAAGVYFENQYATLAELSASIGYEVKEPVSFAEKMDSVKYRNISNMIAEINFRGAGREINYRMSKDKGDNSGIYLEEDATEKTISVDGCEVTLKGYTGENLIAVWEDGTYSYSLYCKQGLKEDEVTSLVKDTLE